MLSLTILHFLIEMISSSSFMTCSPETPLLTSSAFTSSTDQPITMSQLQLADDCLLRSLEYLCNGTDFINFKKSTRRFNRIHSQFMEQQFVHFNVLESFIADNLRRSKYRAIEDLLKSAPCISDLFADIKSPASPRDVFKMYRIHHRSKQDVLRGLMFGSKRPFLSLLLWNDHNWNQTALLICTFNFDQFTNVTLHACARNSFLRDLTTTFPGSHFCLDDFNEILRRKCIQFPGSPTISTWTVGKRKGYYLRNKCRDRPSVIILCFLVLSSIGCVVVIILLIRTIVVETSQV